MPKLTYEWLKSYLNAGEVGRYADIECPGLYFRITGVKTASWVYRFRLRGQRPERPEFGLGKYPTVGLAQARERARANAKLVAAGVDPRKHRAAAQSKQMAEDAKPRTVAQLAAAYLKLKGWDPRPHYTDDNTGYSTCLRFNKHILPLLGDRFVEHVTGDQILKVVSPLWQAKPAQAREVYHLVTDLFDYAIEVHELIPANPARRIGRYLDDQPDSTPQPACPWQEVPEIIAKLRNYQGSKSLRHDIDRAGIIAARKGGMTWQRIADKFGVAMNSAEYICKIGRTKTIDPSLIVARASEMVILTALRTHEVRLMRWTEIDWEQKILTIPRARMKVKKGKSGAFTLPLTKRMIEIFTEMQAISEGRDYIFPGEWMSEKTRERFAESNRDFSAGFPLGQNVLLDFLQREFGYTKTMHGFRSSFSDWAYDQKRFSVFAIEYSQDHVVHGRITGFGTKVAERYHRDRYLEERRELLEAWGKFCSGDTAEIIPLPIPKRQVSA
jgi:integrase